MRCYRHNATPAKPATATAFAALAASRGAAPQRYRRSLLAILWVLTAMAALWSNSRVLAADSPHPANPSHRAYQVSSPPDQAALLVQRTIERLTLGGAFDAMLRQRIWAAGDEVVGIGRYEQSGGGTGRFSLEMTIHDGDTRQSTRQISDGKLAWIRTQLGDSVTLQRVDLGRIDEVYRETTRPGPRPVPSTRGFGSVLAPEPAVPPWMRVGGLVELIDTIANDFDLRLGKGTITGQPVWILRGTLTERARERIHQSERQPSATPLCPFEVRLAIAAVGDADGFGIGLPVRIEFWSQQAVQSDAAASPAESDTAAAPRPNMAAHAADAPRGRLISLLEIYAVRAIDPSPEERFRFARDEPDVTYSNDTQRYLERLAR
jgi:hypothetical protein